MCWGFLYRGGNSWKRGSWKKGIFSSENRISRGFLFRGRERSGVSVDPSPPLKGWEKLGGTHQSQAGESAYLSQNRNEKKGRTLTIREDVSYSGRKGWKQRKNRFRSATVSRFRGLLVFRGKRRKRVLEVRIFSSNTQRGWKKNGGSSSGNTKVSSEKSTLWQRRREEGGNCG